MLDLLRPIAAQGAAWAYLLVSVHGRPIGWITCPVTNGECTPEEQRKAIAATLARPILSALTAECLRAPVAAGAMTPAGLFARGSREAPGEPVLITVAVCTRDRPLDLERCLNSIRCLSYAPVEVIIVDNASSSPATRLLIESQFPEFRYIREDRAGLNWARNCALTYSTGAIIAYTDDDTVVDPQWLSVLAEAFTEETVAAVTGLIAPLALQKAPQLHFEVIGGFGRGFQKWWYRVEPAGERPDVFHLGAGRFGAGANMAFRVPVLKAIGGFDPALDVGTPSEGGGDLEVFFRVLHERHLLVYEPAALIWHHHRDTPTALAAQIATWGTAMGAFLGACFLRYSGFRAQVLRFAVWWSWFGYIGPALRSLIGPGRAPRRIRFGPLRRLPSGVYRYLDGRKCATRLGATPSAKRVADCPEQSSGVAVRAVDLSKELEVLTDVVGFRSSEISIEVDGRFIGVVRIDNRGMPISPAELRNAIAASHSERLLRVLLTPMTSATTRYLDDLIVAKLYEQIFDVDTEFSPMLVSVVVATLNRPLQLQRCLKSLSRQVTNFPYEIVVVDNGPSEETETVVASFPRARYVQESVKGLASARNTGFRSAWGEILVATDDDVVAPPTWLDTIVGPFRFAHVGITTGQVLPLALTHEAQQAFENLGGLGKGGEDFEVGLDWLIEPILRPAPVWNLGATANAAVRRTVLEDARVGLLDESLGPGTPAGGGEDAYLFYRALSAGYSVYYEAHAAVYHEHRSSVRSLRRQMFDYGRGHVAYLLTTLFKNGDLRALSRLLLVLPGWHLWRLLAPKALGPSHDRRIVLSEFLGFLAGPVCWLRSLVRQQILVKEEPLYLLPIDHKQRQDSVIAIAQFNGQRAQGMP